MAKVELKREQSLAVILKNYPYGNGETFFSAELKILSKRFKTIVIVSRQSGVSEQQIHFELPDNVSHVNLDISTSPAQRVLFLVKSLFNGIFLRVLRDILNSQTSISLLTIKTALAYDEAAMLNEKKLLAALKIKDVVPDNFLWYSYWCDDSAYLLSRWKARGIISKAISRAHGYDLYAERHPRNYLPYRSFICHSLDRVICISTHGKNRLTDNYPHLKNKFKVFLLGVSNQASIQTQKPTPFRIVSISTIIPLKNLQILIQAIEKLDNVQLEWHHLGRGNGDAYEDSILQMADTLLSQKPNISFRFHGFIPPEKVMETLKELRPHVLVNSSHFEGIPVSMMEACSLGIPVIGPQIYGVPEIIKNGINGFTFFPVNADSLRQAIAKMTDLTESTYAEMRLNARALQQAEFNAERNHLEFTSYIEEISNETSL